MVTLSPLVSRGRQTKAGPMSGARNERARQQVRGRTSSNRNQDDGGTRERRALVDTVLGRVEDEHRQEQRDAEHHEEAEPPPPRPTHDRVTKSQHAGIVATHIGAAHSSADEALRHFDMTR